MGKEVLFELEVVSYHVFKAYEDVIEKVAEMKELANTKKEPFGFLALGRQIIEFETVTKANTAKAERLVKKHERTQGCIDYANKGAKGYFRLEVQINKFSRHHTGIFKVYEIEKGLGENYTKVDFLHEFSTKQEAEDFAKIAQTKRMEAQFGVYAEDGFLTSITYFKEKYYPTKPQVQDKEGRLVVPAYHYTMVGKVEI